MSACQGLSPPPTARHRASSTNLKATLTASSLGRRRSSSCLHTPDHPAPSPHPPAPSLVIDSQLTTPSESQQSSSMLVIVATRFLEWFHVHPKHSLSWSATSSPRSSTEEFVLPLSATAAKTSFEGDFHEKDTLETSSHSWRQGFPSIHAPILLVMLLLPLSTLVVLFCLSTLPISLSWPRTLTDVAQLGRELHGYSQSGLGPLVHVVGVMSITAIWKHAWSIPGSVVWNVLAGALFSPAYATILLAALTTVGSLCAAMLSKPLAPFLTHFFPRALDITRHAIEGDSDSSVENVNKSPPWVRLSVLRLIGIVPWSGINIACGVCGVAIGDCMLGAFIGSLPWTAVTCQIGDILQTLASTPSPTPQTISSVLTSPEIVFKLVFLSFLSLAPILGRDKLRSLISQSASPPTSAGSADKRVAGWSWIQWRSKMRISTSSASHPLSSESVQRMQQLDVLIQEKRTLEDLSS